MEKRKSGRRKFMRRDAGLEPFSGSEQRYISRRKKERRAQRIYALAEKEDTRADRMIADIEAYFTRLNPKKTLKIEKMSFDEFKIEKERYKNDKKLFLVFQELRDEELLPVLNHIRIPALGNLTELLKLKIISRL